MIGKRLCVYAPALLLASLNPLLLLNAQSDFTAALNVYRSGGPENPDALLRLQTAAAERQQQLQSLMVSDPAAVLAAAMPDEVRTALPADLADVLDRRVSLQGQVQVDIEDGAGYSRLHYGLLVNGQRLEMHFAGPPPSELLTGTAVQVEGVQLGGDLALTAARISTATSMAPRAVTSILPNTFGAQHTLVVLVNFQDNLTQPWTLPAVQSMVLTTASNFWMENSFQQTWITGDVAGWYTLPMTSTTCNYSAIQTYAQQAAQNAGYVLSNYQRFIYAFPQVTACGWDGYSNIGGSPSNSWVNGMLNQWVINHELGHGLGLYHSHSLSCGSAVYASSGCTQYEYGDYYETMGSSNVNGYSMDYNAFQKERLGWLNYSLQPAITTVTASGTYSIGPVEVQNSVPKALKILQSSASGTYYYVEFRQALGFDNYLSLNSPVYTDVLNGVLIHAAAPSSPNSSNLLDMNPTATWGYAMALDVGQSYTDSTAGITISTVSVSGAGASVNVTLAAGTCTPANPAVTISPASQGGTAGSALTYTVTVADKDSAACSGASFNLSAAVPSGWSSVVSSPVLTLSPGASGSATVKVTSPLGTAANSYSVGVTASNAAATSYTASASATYVVSNPVALSMTVSPSAASYTLSQTVSLTATVLSGGSPCSGAAVAATITKSNGSVVTLSGTTGSNGVAVLTYRMKKTDPTGTYQVKASSGSAAASTSFTVH